MLYETAARAGEVLAVNVEDLDLARKRAVITGKGGHKEYVFWASGAARLLSRYLAGRRRGPVFLTHLGEKGASTILLQAKSRHQDPRTLAIYTKPGSQAIAELTAIFDQQRSYP